MTRSKSCEPMSCRWAPSLSQSMWSRVSGRCSCHHCSFCLLTSGARNEHTAYLRMHAGHAVNFADVMPHQGRLLMHPIPNMWPRSSLHDQSRCCSARHCTHAACPVIATPCACADGKLGCRPKAGIQMETEPGKLRMLSKDVAIEGSKQVQDLDLSSRYDVDVAVIVTESGPSSFAIAAEMNLYVDVPPPFNLTPKNLTEGGGNTVVNSLLASLMPAFAEIMVQDIEGSYRQQSQQQIA